MASKKDLKKKLGKLEEKLAAAKKDVKKADAKLAAAKKDLKNAESRLAAAAEAVAAQTPAPETPGAEAPAREAAAPEAPAPEAAAEALVTEAPDVEIPSSEEPAPRAGFGNAPASEGVVPSMSDDDLKSFLESVRTVAIVGLSTDPEKPSSTVARDLIDAGYEVIPVHPKAEEILGRRVYPSLAEIPGHVDIVDVFRPADETPAVARQAVEIGAGTLWLQLGIASAEAKGIAEDAGLRYFEDICLGATAKRLGARAAGAAI